MGYELLLEFADRTGPPFTTPLSTHSPSCNFANLTLFQQAILFLRALRVLRGGDH